MTSGPDRDAGISGKILIVEDNPEVVEILRLLLAFRRPDLGLTAALDGASGLRLAQSETFDLLIVDLGLPDMDGFELLVQIRKTYDGPILILTGRTDEVSRVRAIEAGADAYVTKPFHHMMLLERLTRLLRKPQTGLTAGGRTSYAGRRLVVDFGSGKVSVAGKAQRLTVTEYLLLSYLAANAGNVLTRHALVETVWGEDSPETQDALAGHIHRLRHKLEADPAKPELLQTEKNVGYRLASPA